MTRSDIPIGILTRDRAVYLDVTLQSLEASDLPSGISLAIYDDVSTDPITRRFLDTTETIEIKHKWPTFKEWVAADLGLLDNKPLHGILGKMEVITSDLKACTDPRIREDRHFGVVIASCQAICKMFASYPKASAVILLQDDIVLTPNWYEQLVARLDIGTNQGIVAGMHLDYSGAEKGYYTAQCYMITREFFKAEQVWFGIPHFNRKSFDVQICTRASRAGFKVELLRPYVCQHIGVDSVVRPARPFKEDGWVRMGLKGAAKRADKLLK